LIRISLRGKGSPDLNKLKMENNNPNNLNVTVKESPDAEALIPAQSASPEIAIASLDQKRDELMSSSKINDEVSSYLNELGEKVNPPPIGMPARPLEEKKNLKQSIVRTYKSDAEEAIKMEKMSSVSIALAEEKKKQKYHPIASSDTAPRSKKTLLFVISLLFVFAGIGAFNFNYIKEKLKMTPAPKKGFEIATLITSDSNTEFDLSKLDKKNVVNSLSEIINTTDVKSNSIQNIYVTKNVIGEGKKTKTSVTSKEFLPLIISKIPDILLRSLSPEYMLGVHSWNGNQPFIILKTDSYENAFAGMLSWEKNMAGDLNMLFPRNNLPSIQDGTTTTEQILSYKKDFEDVLVKNKDTRALRNEDGDIFLIYSLPDKETVIITSNTDTLAELFDRIIRSRAIR